MNAITHVDVVDSKFLSRLCGGELQHYSKKISYNICLVEIVPKTQKKQLYLNLLIIKQNLLDRFFWLKQRHCGCIAQPITGVQTGLWSLHHLFFNKQTETLPVCLAGHIDIRQFALLLFKIFKMCQGLLHCFQCNLLKPRYCCYFGQPVAIEIAYYWLIKKIAKMYEETEPLPS